VKSGSTPLLAWGCLLLLLGGGLAAFSELVPALLFLAGATPIFVLAAWNQTRPAGDQTRLLPSFSLPVVVLAVGAALAALGLTAGLWLCLVGAEIALFGAVWLGRELREERRWRR
jgi:hypothetical protein